MPRKISWNFFKVTLQVNEDFGERKKILRARFENADTYNWSYGETVYHYQFYDLEAKKSELTDREIVFGRITRAPKRAHGRSLNQRTHKSSDSFVHIEEIADASEFIYDFDSSVLALHRRAPFYAARTTAKAFKYLLGIPYNTQDPQKVDAHVEIMRDESFSESILDSEQDLREVKLVFAKPNPGSGDHILENIHLGLIGEETLSDEIIFDAKKKSPGSLDKVGFLRRSITQLLGQGYQPFQGGLRPQNCQRQHILFLACGAGSANCIRKPRVHCMKNGNVILERSGRTGGHRVWKIQLAGAMVRKKDTKSYCLST